MKFPKANTILYYLPDSDPAVMLIKKFAEKHTLKVYKADALSDVIAVPYAAAIINSRFLNDQFYGLMRNDEYSILFNNEKMVVSGNERKLPEDVKKHFIIPGQITEETLNELVFSN